LRQLILDCQQDHVHHIIRVAADVIVQAAKDSVPLGSEVVGSTLVIGDVATVGMRRAIDLDDERCSAADKINRKGSDLMLTHKLIVGQASATESGPQSDLGRRLVATQTPSLSQALWFIDARRHRPNTLTRPSATFSCRREKAKMTRRLDLGNSDRDQPT
jgi:hypothetical protein